MIRRLARSCRDLRALPRHLFAVLARIAADVTRLSDDVARLGELRREGFSRQAATLGDIQAEIGEFCADATAALLALDRSMATLTARSDEVARLARDLSRRMETIERRLDGLDRSLGELSELIAALAAAAPRQGFPGAAAAAGPGANAEPRVAAS
jgi:methyl-accepting chemotaxis protein